MKIFNASSPTLVIHSNILSVQNVLNFLKAFTFCFWEKNENKRKRYNTEYSKHPESEIISYSSDQVIEKVCQQEAQDPTKASRQC